MGGGGEGGKGRRGRKEGPRSNHTQTSLVVARRPQMGFSWPLSSLVTRSSSTMPDLDRRKEEEEEETKEKKDLETKKREKEREKTTSNRCEFPSLPSASMAKDIFLSSFNSVCSLSSSKISLGLIFVFVYFFLKYL